MHNIFFERLFCLILYIPVNIVMSGQFFLGFPDYAEPVHNNKVYMFIQDQFFVMYDVCLKLLQREYTNHIVNITKVCLVKI